MSASDAAHTQKRLGPRDWVHAAIDVIIASSVDQVRVERLAATLGVSKGSFYWHFKDRAELLMAVLADWEERATRAVDGRVARAEPQPAGQLLRFMMLPLGASAALRAADLELAIIGWAWRCEEARAVVARVDQARTATMARLFAALGFAPEEAAYRAHQAYAFLRYVAQRRDLPIAARQALIQRMHGALTAAGGAGLLL